MPSRTPRFGHAPFPMHRIAPDLHQTLKHSEHERSLYRFTAIGDFYWFINPDGTRRLIVALPWHINRNPGAFVASDWTIDYPNFGGYKWSWDGNEDKPTLHPSLHWIGIWHGWCQEGLLKEA